MRRWLCALLGASLGTVLVPARAFAQDGAALFADNCAPCHNIGEAGGVGPDLRNIGSRKDRQWLVTFILDPEGVTKSGDAYAVALSRKYDGVVMPPPQGLSRDAVAAILDYVDTRSTGAGPGPVAPPPAEPAFTPEDVSRGLALFLGTARLASGGPSCLACHDAGLGAGLGGGTLAPNLRLIAKRVNTAAWLSAPPTPVMRSLFRRAPLAPDEVRALTAFFEDRARPEATAVPPGTRRFAALGVAGTIALLLLVGAAWRGRLRPVRRALIARAADRRAPAATHTHGFRSGGPR
jgi:mono/diheme cytochrome c family protein